MFKERDQGLHKDLSQVTGRWYCVLVRRRSSKCQGEECAGPAWWCPQAEGLPAVRGDLDCDGTTSLLRDLEISPSVRWTQLWPRQPPPQRAGGNIHHGAFSRMKEKQGPEEHRDRWSWGAPQTWGTATLVLPRAASFPWLGGAGGIAWVGAELERKGRTGGKPQCLRSPLVFLPRSLCCLSQAPRSRRALQALWRWPCWFPVPLGTRHLLLRRVGSSLLSGWMGLPWLRNGFGSFKLVLTAVVSGLPPQKCQCFTFDDEEREERKVGTLSAFSLQSGV